MVDDAEWLETGSLGTHRFALDEFMDAHDVFRRPGDTGAVKVVLTNEAEPPRRFTGRRVRWPCRRLDRQLTMNVTDRREVAMGDIEVGDEGSNVNSAVNEWAARDAEQRDGPARIVESPTRWPVAVARRPATI
jgi:hypothetical protein